MTKLLLFLGVLLALGIADAAVMRKKGITREVLPYLIIAIAAGVMGAVYFLEPYRDSVIASLNKFLHISE